jgi:metallophosphoesterase (TIGR00282 family)
MPFRALLIGDIVGRPGREAVARALPGLIETEGLDLVVANSENAAAGSGINPSIYKELRGLGVDVLTMGDHCYRRKEAMPLYEGEDRLLRPANLPDEATGRGWTVVESRKGIPVAVVSLLGRTYLKPIDCPFKAADRALGAIGQTARLVLVDFHAEATSDKIAMGWYLDGRATAVVGTHTHVQTADERVLPKGTAYVTDLGMTGPYDSVLGRDRNRVVKALVTGVPQFFEVATGDVRLCGAIVTADGDSGRALSIRRVNIPCVTGAEEASKPPEEKMSGQPEDI